MSAVVRTPECFPEIITLRGVLVPVEAPARHHECPGGQHVPGVLGGWHCPCPCHLAEHQQEKR